MIADILHWLGLPGQVVVAASVLIGLYHLRDVTMLLSRIGTMVWIGIVAVGLFVAFIFAVPGLDLVVQIEGLSGAIWSGLQSLVEQVWRSL
ncbi:hypothetical protein [Halorhabdus amylolytica]|uniref:hypothetical protein n=1 Tax=Halorhabdus amylolytica TaxID=2559573 RepID=UPI0010A9A298|nr:hypothetical protein [Halorhabdus amylolytica]